VKEVDFVLFEGPFSLGFVSDSGKEDFV